MANFNEVLNVDPRLNVGGVVDPQFALEKNDMAVASLEQQLADSQARENELANLAAQATADFKKAEEARLAAEAAVSNLSNTSNVNPVYNVNVAGGEASRLNKQLQDLNKKYEEVKNIAREGRKKGEVAKHSKPQIKRSIGFIFDVKYSIEDLKELMSNLIDSHLKGDGVDGDSLLLVKDKIEEMETVVDKEMEANEIASASRFGWGTVKYFENYSVFKDSEDAEKKSQRFYQAEGKARANFSNKRGGFRGRGRFNPYNNVNNVNSNSNNSNAVNNSNNFNNGKFFDKRSRVTSETVCFKCNLKGHMRADCPKN